MKKIMITLLAWALMVFPAYADIIPEEVYTEHLERISFYTESNIDTVAQEVIDTCENNYEILGYSYEIIDGKCYAEFEWRPTAKLLYGMEENQKLEDAAKEIIGDIINDGDSDYRKVHVITKWIAENVDYDFSALSEDIRRTDYGQFAENAIFDGKAVCAGYADAFYLLCNMSGVEARLVYGECNGIKHVWNAVKLRDEWYFTDTTDKSGRAFLRGTEWFAQHGYYANCYMQYGTSERDYAF